jgi:hypothetical protein
MQKIVQTLIAQHDELRALRDTYERELAKPEPDLMALAKCRWTLARLVSTHLAFEQMHMKVLLGRSEPVIAQLTQERQRLAQKLDEHVRNWTPNAIADNWADYGRVSRSVMAVLIGHLDREERDLYPLLLQAKAA